MADSENRPHGTYATYSEIAGISWDELQIRLRHTDGEPDPDILVSIQDTKNTPLDDWLAFPSRAPAFGAISIAKVVKIIAPLLLDSGPAHTLHDALMSLVHLHLIIPLSTLCDNQPISPTPDEVAALYLAFRNGQLHLPWPFITAELSFAGREDDRLIHFMKGHSTKSDALNLACGPSDASAPALSRMLASQAAQFLADCGAQIGPPDTRAAPARAESFRATILRLGGLEALAASAPDSSTHEARTELVRASADALAPHGSHALTSHAASSNPPPSSEAGASTRKIFNLSRMQLDSLKAVYTILQIEAADGSSQSRPFAEVLAAWATGRCVLSTVDVLGLLQPGLPAGSGNGLPSTIYPIAAFASFMLAKSRDGLGSTHDSLTIASLVRDALVELWARVVRVHYMHLPADEDSCRVAVGFVHAILRADVFSAAFAALVAHVQSAASRLLPHSPYAGVQLPASDLGLPSSHMAIHLVSTASSWFTRAVEEQPFFYLQFFSGVALWNTYLFPPRQRQLKAEIQRRVDSSFAAAHASGRARPDLSFLCTAPEEAVVEARTMFEAALRAKAAFGYGTTDGNAPNPFDDPFPLTRRPPDAAGSHRPRERSHLESDEPPLKRITTGHYTPPGDLAPARAPPAASHRLKPAVERSDMFRALSAPDLVSPEGHPACLAYILGSCDAASPHHTLKGAGPYHHPDPALLAGFRHKYCTPAGI